MQYLSGSLRGYTMLNIPNSCVYPKWGIGFEVGASGNLGFEDIYNLMGYGYIYGYIPGITDTQGAKLSVTHQQALGREAIFNQAVVNTLPRGMSSHTAILSWLSLRNPSITKLSADYSIPIYIGDVGILGGFFYIKRLVLTPHFDYTFAGKYELYSAGCDLNFDLNSILWLGWPCSIGVTYSYNGGKSFEALRINTGSNIGQHFVGPTFNVSF